MQIKVYILTYILVVLQSLQQNHSSRSQKHRLPSELFGRLPCKKMCRRFCDAECLDDLLNEINDSGNKFCMGISSVLAYRPYLVDTLFIDKTKQTQNLEQYSSARQQRSREEPEMLQENVSMQKRQCQGTKDKYSCVDESDPINQFKCQKHERNNYFWCQNVQKYPSLPESLSFDWPQNFDIQNGIFPVQYYKLYYQCIDDLIKKIENEQQIDYLLCQQNGMTKISSQIKEFSLELKEKQILEKVESPQISQFEDVNQQEKTEQFVYQETELNEIDNQSHINNLTSHIQNLTYITSLLILFFIII